MHEGGSFESPLDEIDTDDELNIPSIYRDRVITSSYLTTLNTTILIKDLVGKAARMSLTRKAWVLSHLQ